MDKEYIAEAEKIEALLREFLPAVPGEEWFGRIFPRLDIRSELTESLLEPGRDLFSRGGKRWRPIMAHLVCRVLGGGDAVLSLLPMVEFCHTASLIHDDLEDSSGQRRGKPAVHLIYGADTAINAGAFLYFLPLTALEHWKADAEDRNRLWQLWGEHMRFLHLGQSMDIAWHRDPAYFPSLEDYMLMSSLKTGCLARFAALLGAETARISLKNSPPQKPSFEINEGLLASLGAAAQRLGIGFQILDDVKNLVSGIKGKERGDDVVEGKKSLPVLLFIQTDTAERTAFVQHCFKAAGEGGVNVPEVEEFITALTEAGALAEAQKQGRNLISEAGAAFSALPAVDKEAGRLLTSLTELLQ
ncbi:MAG: polyprenyl synthetase family protein [Treponema sp.]|nr:polyprenyl synthetase family protein [Treponema sp.]